jgi:hypothetical protein
LKEGKAGPGTKSYALETKLLSYIDGLLNETEKMTTEQHLLNAIIALTLFFRIKKRVMLKVHSPMPRLEEKEEYNCRRKRQRAHDIVLKFTREAIEVISNPETCQ